MWWHSQEKGRGQLALWQSQPFLCPALVLHAPIMPSHHKINFVEGARDSNSVLSLEQMAEMVLMLLSQLQKAVTRRS